MHESVIWSPGQTLESLEKEIIIKAFGFYRQNKTATANSLGISIRTLENKFERYEADRLKQEVLDERHRKEREYFLARSRGLAAEPLELTPVEAAPIPFPPKEEEPQVIKGAATIFKTPNGKTVKL